MNNTFQKALPNKKHLTSDLVAGLTFAVANIPTAMAHAILATVNPVLGINTLMVAVPIGAIFSSSVYMNISTTSALSVAVGSSLAAFPTSQKVDALTTLVMLVGIIALVLGLLKAGSMLRFVPNSVMVGFINGVAILIILGQLSDLTGYNSAYSNKIAQTLDMALNTSKIHWQSLLIGLLTIAIILGLNKTRFRKISALGGLITATFVVYGLKLEGVELIKDVANLTGSLPHPALPNLSLIPRLIIPAISIAIVGLVQGAAVSQNFPNPNGKYPSASGDFFGVGMANLVASFFQGIPAGGSMSGTSLNISSGAKSRWTNIFAGLFVIIITLAFSGFVNLIPMPALAGLVLLAGFQSLQIPAAITVWNTGRVSTVLMGLTFILTLIIPLQFAVLVGVAFSILLFVMQESNRVQIKEWVMVPDGYPLEQPAPVELPSGKVTTLMIYGSVFFAASKVFEKSLPLAEETDHAVVIIGLRGHSEVGSTFINTLWRYSDTLQAHNSKLVLVGINQEVYDKLERTGFLSALGPDNVYLATDQIGESMNQALDSAHRWLES